MKEDAIDLMALMRTNRLKNKGRVKFTGLIFLNN